MSDLSYLKEKHIAVLGGGAVAKAVSADSALAGAKVRLCDMEPFAAKPFSGSISRACAFTETSSIYSVSAAKARPDTTW